MSWLRRFTPEGRAERLWANWPTPPEPPPPPKKHPVQISVGEHLDAIRPVLASFNSQGRHVTPDELQRAWAAYDELRRLFG